MSQSDPGGPGRVSLKSIERRDDRDHVVDTKRSLEIDARKYGHAERIGATEVATESQRP